MIFYSTKARELSRLLPFLTRLAAVDFFLTVVFKSTVELDFISLQRNIDILFNGDFIKLHIYSLRKTRSRVTKHGDHSLYGHNDRFVCRTAVSTGGDRGGE